MIRWISNESFNKIKCTVVKMKFEIWNVKSEMWNMKSEMWNNKMYQKLKSPIQSVSKYKKKQNLKINKL